MIDQEGNLVICKCPDSLKDTLLCAYECCGQITVTSQMQSLNRTMSSKCEVCENRWLQIAKHCQLCRRCLLHGQIAVDSNSSLGGDTMQTAATWAMAWNWSSPEKARFATPRYNDPSDVACRAQHLSQTCVCKQANCSVLAGLYNGYMILCPSPSRFVHKRVSSRVKYLSSLMTTYL